MINKQQLKESIKFQKTTDLIILMKLLNSYH